MSTEQHARLFRVDDMASEFVLGEALLPGRITSLGRPPDLTDSVDGNADGRGNSTGLSGNSTRVAATEFTGYLKTGETLYESAKVAICGNTGNYHVVTIGSRLASDAVCSARWMSPTLLLCTIGAAWYLAFSV